MKNPVILSLLFFVFACTPGRKDPSPPSQEAAARGAETAPAKDPFTGLLVSDKHLPWAFKHGVGPKPPQSGLEKMDAFPQPPAPPSAVPVTPLAVTRVQPTGEIGPAAALTVAFNQPMIPLASVGDTREFPIPVQLEPRIPGRWRWLGTTLLAFEPELRFNFATHYNVRIPAGIKSATGATLASEARFTFSTPPLAVDWTYPGNGSTHARPDSVIVLRFNQKINPAQLEPFIQMTRAGTSPVAMKLLTPEEAAAHPFVKKHHVRLPEPDRGMVFQPVAPLPLASPYSLMLKKDAPSAEGPRKTERPVGTGFTTYGPLVVRRIRCGWSNEPCRPGYHWHIEFSNSVVTDEKEVLKRIRVTPKVADLTLEMHGGSGSLQGSFKAATTYTISVNPGLEDMFGQKMTQAYTTKIQVADHHPYLILPARQQAVLEATTSRTIPIPAMNITSRSTVKMFRVEPENLFRALENAGRHYYRESKNTPSDGLGKPAVEMQVIFNPRKNLRNIAQLGLDRALNKKNGIVFVEIHSPDLAKDRWDSPWNSLLAQVTNIGLTARYDAQAIHVYATSLTEGRALPNVPIRVFRRDPSTSSAKLVAEGFTGTDGLVTLPGPVPNKEFGQHVVVATLADDTAFVLLDGGGDDGGYASSYSWGATSGPREEDLRAFMFTDRDPYRPGETVEISGWLRRIEYGPTGSISFLRYKKAEVEWEIRNPQGESVQKGKSPVDANGAFSVRFTSAPDATLGRYSIQGRLLGVPGMENRSVYHGFSVLAYRTPEHEVNVRIKPADYLYGQELAGDIEGRYTFGAPMRQSDVNYSIFMEESHYRPPRHPEWTFGIPARFHWGGCWGRRCPSLQRTIASESGNLDDNGFLHVKHKLPALQNPQEPKPSLLTLEASVTDVNRQSISSRTTTLVHPAEVYVGVRMQKNLVRENETFELEGILVGIDGTPAKSAHITFTAFKREWRRRPQGKAPTENPWEEVDDHQGGCGFMTDTDARGKCDMKLPRAGFYIIKAESKDRHGNLAVTHRHLYVAGKDAVSWRQDNINRIEMVLDKETPYNPGETARVLIQAPFYPVTGMLTVEREGIVSNRLIQVNSSTHVEEIPIIDSHIPNLHVAVALIRGRVKMNDPAGDDPGRPLLATGRVRIPVSVESRKINITAKPSKPVAAPGETIELDLHTVDASGKPVASRMAVMLVDEGVLSLLGFSTPDPMAVFYTDRSIWSALRDLRVHLLKRTSLKDDVTKKVQEQEKSAELGMAPGGRTAGRGVMPKTAMRMAAPMADAAPAEEAQTGGDFGGIAMRAFFATTAYFNNEVRTNAQGRVKLSIQLPENLTTFRIMVVAMDPKTPDRFGSAEDRVTVRKDFMLRAALPRFANFRDHFEASVVLNTLLDGQGTAEVKIDGSGFELQDDAVKSVSLNSQKTQELRFRVRTPNPGEARFTFAARYRDQTDGVAAPAIPVHVPVTTENTAVYGMTDKAVAQPIAPPAKVLPQFGGLDVHMSSTGLIGLQDAIAFLIDNPHNYSESIASRLVPIFALKDIIPAFKLGSAEDEKRLHELAIKGIAELTTYQDYSGGFKLWQGSYHVWPFVTAYITWALIRGKEAGFMVPDRVLQNAANFLRNYLNNNRLDHYWYYSWTTQIYCAWVLTEIQRLNLFTPQQMDRWRLKTHLHRLYGVRDKVGFLGRTWLLHALWRIEGKSDKVLELLRNLENSAVETAAGAHFAEVTTEGQALLMHSQARTDAVVLRVLLDVDPEHVLLSKIVRGLMASRVRGSWETSQGNAFVLDALAAYFRVVESEVPDFQVHAWYRNLFAGSKKFQGRSMDLVHARIGMHDLLKQGAGNLILTKDGPGKLYYRLGLAYVPADLNLPAESQGFFVRRTYEAMDDEKAVQQVSPGKWRIKAGETVQVKLTLIVPDRRHFVALEDPFPAGFEGVDMRLKTAPQSRRDKTGSNLKSPSYSWWWHQPTHSEMRDDRFVAYYDRLHAGVFEYVYLARATTIGTFTAPPTRVVEIYTPEVFGRAAGEQVEIIP